MGKANKKRKKLSVVNLLFGIIFFCGAIYLLVNGLSNYIERVKQSDWIETDAVVISVNESVESSGVGLRHTTYRTVYDVEYQYDVDGNKQMGTIYHSSDKKEAGEIFKIKYNPADPSKSTDELKASGGYILTGMLGFVLIGAIGLLLLSSFFRDIKKKNKAVVKHNNKK